MSSNYFSECSFQLCLLVCLASLPLTTNGQKMTDNCPVTTPGQQSPPSTPQSPTDLLQLLRRFLDQLGTVLSEETKWSKEVIDKFMKDGMFKYCQGKSALISKFEYGGSLYENLKTLRPDEDDVVIHVVLKAKKGFVTFDMKETGHTLVKASEGSPYKEYSNEDGFLMTKKIKSWLFKLISSAVQDISSNGASSVSIKASSCSTGVKVVITEKSKMLEVQLVPSFQFSSDEYFTPPNQYVPGKTGQGWCGKSKMGRTHY